MLLFFNINFMAASGEYQNDVKSKKTFTYSIILFVWVLVLTLGIYFYNVSLQSKMEKKQQELQKIEANIIQLKQDKSLELYTLVESNKSYLETFAYRSDIPLFIRTFRELSKKFQVVFWGFSYSDGVITSDVRAQSDVLGSASSKASKFIEAFRKQDDQIFSLDFVPYFKGQSVIDFGIKFLIK